MVNTLYKRSKQAMHNVYVDTVKTKIKACIALNAMYVNTVDTQNIHISVHNFLNIQWILNLEKVLES